jgi:hypothetical protein
MATPDQTITVSQSVEAGFLLRGQMRRALEEYLFARGHDPLTALQESKARLDSVFYIRFQGTAADQAHLNAYLKSIYEMNATVNFTLDREQYQDLEERTGTVPADEFNMMVTGHGFFKGKTYEVSITREGARFVANVLDSAGHETDMISTALGQSWRTGRYAGTESRAGRPPVSSLGQAQPAPSATPGRGREYEF